MPTLLTPVPCTQCHSPAVFLWCSGTEALCEKCVPKIRKRESAGKAFKMLIGPRRTEDETWIQDENLSVFGLRAFIDDCLALEPSSYPHDLLTTDADVISSFIENLASRVSQPKRIANKNEVETLEHAIRRLRRYFEMWKRGDLPFVLIREVPWVILKPSGNSWPTIERYCNRLKKTRNHRYDDERLRFLFNLKPDEVCCGLGNYEGYLVFVFNARNTAVMERAKVGNAIFIVNADRWRFLSQQSKTELLTDYSNEVESFPHAGHIWRRWLRAALRRRGILPPDAPFK